MCGVIGGRSLLKKSGCRTPRIELEEMGPSLDLVLRRTHLASDDLYKLAHRQPRALKVRPRRSLSIFSSRSPLGLFFLPLNSLSSPFLLRSYFPSFFSPSFTESTSSWDFAVVLKLIRKGAPKFN